MEKREIYARIADEAVRGEQTFATNVQVTRRVQQALDDPNYKVDNIARLIQAEPLLAARVVAMANSAAFNRSGREITDVRTAVARLGFQTIRALAMAVAARQMSGKAASPAARGLADQLWEHTAHVAALAHVIARRVTHQDPETALFAGILHEVGGFYLLSRAKDFPDLLEGELTDWVEEGEVAIGRAVLKMLAVPEPVAEAIEAYWEGFLAMPPATLGDTLLLADDLAPVDSPLRRPPAESRTHTEGSIDVVLGEETLASILAEAADEVASLTGALRF